jgi:hypothetical protein
MQIAVNILGHRYSVANVGSRHYGQKAMTRYTVKALAIFAIGGRDE